MMQTNGWRASCRARKARSSSDWTLSGVRCLFWGCQRTLCDDKILLVHQHDARYRDVLHIIPVVQYPRLPLRLLPSFPFYIPPMLTVLTGSWIAFNRIFHRALRPFGVREQHESRGWQTAQLEVGPSVSIFGLNCLTYFWVGDVQMTARSFGGIIGYPCAIAQIWRSLRAPWTIASNESHIQMNNLKWESYLLHGNRNVSQSVFALHLRGKGYIFMMGRMTVTQVWQFTRSSQRALNMTRTPVRVLHVRCHKGRRCDDQGRPWFAAHRHRSIG
ncbi:hypothetical protein BC827DRAFT_1173769 [Russula dissimulans]|nr:hypothetical protein BC827DRAFT_1173769 [Russula dissimulans]